MFCFTLYYFMLILHMPMFFLSVSSANILVSGFQKPLLSDLQSEVYLKYNILLQVYCECLIFVTFDIYILTNCTSFNYATMTVM